MTERRFAMNITLAIMAIMIPISAFGRELSTQGAIDSLATLLTEAGEAIFNKDGKHPSPQILFGIGGTSAYGSCVSPSNSNLIPGSFYCPKTNTIILEVNQLETLRRKYGDGAVVYALAHEYGHYIQRIYGSNNNTTFNELQADCIAGAILKSSEKKIGLDQSDLREIVTTAAAVGGGTHGTPEQRAGAVLYGWQKGNITECFPDSSKASLSSHINSKETEKKATDSVSRESHISSKNQIPIKNYCVNNYPGNDAPAKGFKACFSLRRTFSNGDKYIVSTLSHPRDQYLHKFFTSGTYTRGYNHWILSCQRRVVHNAYDNGALMLDPSNPGNSSGIYAWSSIDNASDTIIGDYRILRRFCSKL